MQECCHSNESAVCCTSVTCVDDLLASIEQLSRGVGMDETSAAVVIHKYKEKKDGTLLSVLPLSCVFAFFLWIYFHHLLMIVV